MRFPREDEVLAKLARMSFLVGFDLQVVRLSSLRRRIAQGF